MRTKIGVGGLAAVIPTWLLTTVFARTQTSQQEPPYVLKENVHLVIVPVTVKARDGSLVEDLTRDDFRVFEDGRERSIQYFSNELTPLSVIVLLDTGISEKSLGAVRGALRALSNLFSPDDEEALYLFDNNVRLAQDFTSKADLLAEGVQKAEPKGAGPSLIGGPLAAPPVINGVPIDRPGTVPNLAPPVGKRLYDALYTAAQRLKTRPLGRRRVVLIISDGVNGSDNEFSYHQMIDALEVSDVTVYAVSFGSGWGIKRKDLLARVARETGGDIAYVQRKAGLDSAYFRLTDESRNSYVLGFAPASADGKFHEIQVHVVRPGLRWIARNRFFAPPLK